MEDFFHNLQSYWIRGEEVWLEMTVTDWDNCQSSKPTQVKLYFFLSLNISHR